jgi:TnpA family transposase
MVFENKRRLFSGFLSLCLNSSRKRAFLRSKIHTFFKSRSLMPSYFLTNAERERFNQFPSLISEEDLIAFFTLSASDRIEIETLRGTHNRFGFALQICTLRFLGFIPQDLSSAPIEATQFIGEQLALPITCLTDYGRRPQTRQNHVQSTLDYLGFRRANSTDWNNLRAWLIERALEHDKPTLLLGFACKYLYTKKILRPGISKIESLVIEVRKNAWMKTYLQIDPILDKKLQKILDNLLIIDSDLGKTPIAWLRQGATSNSALSILRSLNKISFLRNFDVTNWDLLAMNPNRIKFLAQLGRKATNQYLQNLTPERRYPIIVAFLRQSLIDITDEAVEIFDQALWDCYGDSKKDFDEFQKQTSKSKDKNLKLFQRIIPHLIAADMEAEEIISKILKVAPRQLLMDVYKEISTTVRKHEGHFDFFAKRFSYIQRFAPEFLKTFEFKTGNPDDDLIMAIRILCKYNTKPYNDPIPNDAPIGFVSSKWKPYIFDDRGNIVRRYYVLCVLWELRVLFELEIFGWNIAAAIYQLNLVLSLKNNGRN